MDRLSATFESEILPCIFRQARHCGAASADFLDSGSIVSNPNFLMARVSSWRAQYASVPSIFSLSSSLMLPVCRNRPQTWVAVNEEPIHDPAIMCYRRKVKRSPHRCLKYFAKASKC